MKTAEGRPGYVVKKVGGVGYEAKSAGNMRVMDGPLDPSGEIAAKYGPDQPVVKTGFYESPVKAFHRWMTEPYEVTRRALAIYLATMVVVGALLGIWLAE